MQTQSYQIVRPQSRRIFGNFFVKIGRNQTPRREKIYRKLNQHFSKKLVEILHENHAEHCGNKIFFSKKSTFSFNSFSVA